MNPTSNINPPPIYRRSATEIANTDVSDIKNLEEGWFVEFKSHIPDTAKLAKSISSFANSHGGIIIIGIQEEQKTRRFARFEAMSRESAELCIQRARESVASHVTPPVFYEVNSIDTNPSDSESASKWIVIISIPKGRNGPYLHSNGCIYVRVGDSAAPHALTDLTLQERLWSDSLHRKQRLKSRIESLSLQLRQGNPSIHVVIIEDEIRLDRSTRTYSGFRAVALGVKGKAGGSVFDHVQTLDNSFVARRLGNQVDGRGMLWEYDYRRRLHFVHIPIATHNWDGSSLSNLGEGLDTDRLNQILTSNNPQDTLIISNLLPTLVLLSLILGKIQQFHEQHDHEGQLKINARIVDSVGTVPFLGTSTYFDEVLSTGFPCVFRELGFLWPTDDSSNWHTFDAAPSDTIESADLEYEISTSFFVFSRLAESMGISLNLSLRYDEAAHTMDHSELAEMFSRLLSSSFSFTSQQNPKSVDHARGTSEIQ